MHTLLRHADDLQFPGVKISVLVDEVRARRPILYLGFDSITALQATVLAWLRRRRQAENGL
jgi:hypothetical protein